MRSPPGLTGAAEAPTPKGMAAASELAVALALAFAARASHRESLKPPGRPSSSSRRAKLARDVAVAKRPSANKQQGLAAQVNRSALVQGLDEVADVVEADGLEHLGVIEPRRRELGNQLRFRNGHQLLSHRCPDGTKAMPKQKQGTSSA
jgi:hypothetical protein